MTQSIKNFAGIGSIAFAAFMLLALPTSFAHADGEASFDFYPDQYVDSPSNYQDQSYDFYPDTTVQDNSYDFYPEDQSYDFYPDSGYSMGSGYGIGGYSSGGYSVGGYTSSGYISGYSYPVRTTPAPVATPVVNNTCVGTNNCNTNIDSHNIVATVQQTQVCASGYYGTFPNCYLNTPVYTQPVVYQQPVVTYNQTPYVSLSQVPYTGLDLGFWGSIAYWGAFVLFALFAAYLIAIKRVQNTIASYLKSVLFGTEDTEVEVAPAVETIETVEVAPVAVATNADVIDSFIMNQINRARTA